VRERNIAPPTRITNNLLIMHSNSTTVHLHTVFFLLFPPISTSLNSSSLSFAHSSPPVAPPCPLSLGITLQRLTACQPAVTRVLIAPPL
jgi:hypothetical protein